MFNREEKKEPSTSLSNPTRRVETIAIKTARGIAKKSNYKRPRVSSCESESEPESDSEIEVGGLLLDLHPLIMIRLSAQGPFQKPRRRRRQGLHKPRPLESC